MYAIAFGIATLNANREIIEVYYPAPQLLTDGDFDPKLLDGLANGLLSDDVKPQLLASLPAGMVKNLSMLEGHQKPIVVCYLDSNRPPENIAEAFLKLHLLSHRLVRPHETDLTGIFGVLANLAWTNQGAIDLPDLPQRQRQARLAGDNLSVDCIDKFPKMTDYVVPSGVRIADTSRVRLGAYIGEGTTVMHEGFVNFNAGTEGPNMIEGRISAGVFVGSGSDLGGGSSIMGTLSGGGTMVVSLGKNCLIGANGGTGVPLGDHCTIEAGLYITAGTKVALFDSEKQPAGSCKARQLAGQDNLLFWRNSETGTIECRTSKNQIELNSELHQHN